MLPVNAEINFNTCENNYKNAVAVIKRSQYNLKADNVFERTLYRFHIINIIEWPSFRIPILY